MEGRPPIVLSKEWLTTKIQEGLTFKEIINEYKRLGGKGISEKTISRRCAEWGMFQINANDEYNQLIYFHLGLKKRIGDEELHQKLTEIKKRTDGKNLGSNQLKAELSLDNMCVSLKRVKKYNHEIDPAGAEERRKGMQGGCK